MKTCMSLMLFLALSAAWPVKAMAEDMDFAAASGHAASTLTIASITDLAAIRPMIEGFQKSHPDIAVSYRESTSDILDGQAATACREGRFLADLIISSSLPQQVWLVNNGCAQPIAVPDIARLPGWAKWRDELVGLTFEPAVIVYNKAAFKDGHVPKDRFEFIDMLRQSDRFSGRIGTYDIEKSGVGYFFAFEGFRAGQHLGPASGNHGAKQGRAFLLHVRDPRPGRRRPLARRLQCAWLLRLPAPDGR